MRSMVEGLSHGRSVCGVAHPPSAARTVPPPREAGRICLETIFAVHLRQVATPFAGELVEQDLRRDLARTDDFAQRFEEAAFVVARGAEAAAGAEAPAGDVAAVAREVATERA